MYHRRKVLVDFNLLFLRLIFTAETRNVYLPAGRFLNSNWPSSLDTTSLSATHTIKTVAYGMFSSEPFYKDMAGNHIAFLIGFAAMAAPILTTVSINANI